MSCEPAAVQPSGQHHGPRRTGGGSWGAYGAGLQIHVEDLAAHIAGRERDDTEARFDELKPAYEDLAANISSPGR